MNQRLGVVLRLGGGAAILACLVWRLGAGPFLDGLRAVDAWSIIAALALGVVTTVCGAWRWRVVARGLGISLPLRAAVAASYRAQFLNTALPGGVLGDVHRGVRHGRQSGDVARGLRAVAWERIAGQAVQVAVAIAVLALVPSPFRHLMPIALAAVIGAAVVIVAIAWAVRRSDSGRFGRLLRIAAADVRFGLLARDAWPAVVITSVVVVAGHAATFLIAVRAVGTGAALSTLLPITLLVLLATAVPTNIGGWGPREGVAAWAFTAAGLGAAQGLATATAFGVLVVCATLPGAVVLVVEARSSAAGEQPSGAESARVPITAGRAG